MVLRRRPRDLHRWSQRIGADHAEIFAGRYQLVAGARGQDRDVASRDIESPAVVTAELHARMPTGDAERLMHGRMVVQIIVDAVAPHRAPAIRAEQSLDGLFRVIVRNVDRGLVDQERHRIIGHEAVVLEDEGEGFDIGADDGHWLPPKS